MDYYKFGLIPLLVLAGCVAGGPSMIDCGNDLECFQDAAKTCTPAKVRITEEGTTMYMEMRGMSNDKCTTYMKIEKVEVPPEIPPEMAGFVTMFEGKEMTCNLPMDMASGVSPESVMGQTASTEDFFEMCEGSLVDTLQSLMAGLQGMMG